MGYIGDEVVEEAAKYAIPIQQLGPEESEDLREKLRHRYGLAVNHYGIWLTAKFVAFTDPQGWSLPADYIGFDEVVLLFPGANDSTIWVIPNGKNLVRLLAECSGWTFFLTSREANYFMAFDEYHSLLAAGDAAEWLVELGGTWNQLRHPLEDANDP